MSDARETPMTFAQLVELMRHGRSGAEDRIAGEVRVRTVDSVHDVDAIGPDDHVIVHHTFGQLVVQEFSYRIFRHGDLVRCESLDGAVHYIAGRDQVWVRNDRTDEPVIWPREDRFVVPLDDFEFGANRPDADRWKGDDFTRPIGEPRAVEFLGRAAFEIVLAPPPHKPYEMELVVDAQTGIVLCQRNPEFGSFEMWTELKTAADLPDELFAWDDATDVVADPLPPTLTGGPTERDRDHARERLRILDAILMALQRRHELFDLLDAAETLPQAMTTLQQTWHLNEMQAAAVLDLQVRRFTPEMRSRIVAERDGMARFVNGEPS